MDFKDYVKYNQEVTQFVKDAVPGSIDKYVGTLDYASARFNTILLKLSQEPLMADQYKDEVKVCFNARRGNRLSPSCISSDITIVFEK